MGVIDENPSSTDGVTKIMIHLLKYVPVYTNEDPKKEVPYIIPCHGDQLSVERMTSAKRARACDPTKTDGLEGLEEIPQEFHHRGLMLQVSISSPNY